ncbi:MAG: transporter substrate-binding domain-containing protein [Acidimicrobiales bacterium]|jgi:basic membrane protein A
MSNKMMRLLAVLLGFALLATACGSDDTETPATTAAPTTVAADDAPETTEAESGLPDLGGRTVTVAIENAYLPFNYIDATTGEAGGWDYDAIDEICARINCIPDYQEFAWDGMIIAVSEGQFDLAADGISVTDERAQVVDYSISYITTDQKILVAKGSTEITSKADLAASDCNVGSQTGTTNYDVAVEVVGENRVVAFEQFGFAVQALISGDVCAVIMDDVAGNGYQGENPDDVELVDEVLAADPLAFIFPKGSDLVAAFDAALESMIADGTLENLAAKYFTDSFSLTYGDIEDGVYGEDEEAAGDHCIGLVTDVGQVDDKSFNQSAWEGAQAGAEAAGASVDYIETQDAKDYANNIGMFADAGCEIIVTVGFGMGEATVEAAANYPDVYFIGVDQFQGEETANVVGLLFPEDKAGFLAGALAASLSETGVIAAVLGTNMVPPVQAFGAGYANGAAHINPDIEVIKTYHPGGFDIAFSDPEWGGTTARQAMDSGADVVFGAGGKTGNGALIEVAGEAGAFCIGVDSDQWYTVPEAHPCLVTSAMKLITPGVADLIVAFAEGNETSGNFFGSVGLAPYHDLDSSVSQEIQDMIIALDAALMDGSQSTGYSFGDE